MRGPDKEGTIAVSESQRLALHAAARATLGEKEGDTLMALTPPANTDLATTQHLDRVEEKLDGRICTTAERLEARITATEERLEARITATAERLDVRITATAERLDVRITATEERLDTRIATTAERLDARITATEARLIARIETSALRTRLWTFGAVVAAQVASLTYLTNTLG